MVLQSETAGVDRALQALDGVRGVERVTVDGDYPAFRVLGKRELNLCPAIYDLARQQDWLLRELRHDRRTLETVFNELATAA
jgi:hypothetical protein